MQKACSGLAVQAFSHGLLAQDQFRPSLQGNDSAGLAFPPALARATNSRGAFQNAQLRSLLQSSHCAGRFLGLGGDGRFPIISVENARAAVCGWLRHGPFCSASSSMGSIQTRFQRDI
jgi:hypothetical protein